MAAKPLTTAVISQMARTASNLLHFAVQLVARIQPKGWLYITAIVTLAIIQQQGT